jgi:hypothetical protein
MATQDDVRRITLSLPEAVQEESGFRFAVIDPDKGRRSFHAQCRRSPGAGAARRVPGCATVPALTEERT